MNIKNIVSDIKSMIDAEQVKNKIATDLGIRFKNNKCRCWLHTNSADTVMSFDDKNKRFKCFSCNETYDIFTHYKEYYHLSFLDSLRSIVRDFGLNIFIEENKSVRMANNKPKLEVIELSLNELVYINKRCISKETLDYVKNVKSDGNGNVVFQYKNEIGELVANKLRPARKLGKKDLKTWFEKGTNINTLFNMENIDMSKTLAITEGEFDCLALIEAGYKNSVSVPTGAGSSEWITVNYDWLEQFEEIIVVFDNDEAGIKGAREVISRLPNMVKMAIIKDYKDINEMLLKSTKESILEVLKNANTELIKGVSTLDMIEDFDVYEAEKVKTGIKGIDDKILGVLYGSLNVFSGRNGAGKSTILNQIYVGESIRQGEKVFLFSGELAGNNVKHWLLQTLASEEDYVEATSKDGYKYKKIKNTKAITEKIKDNFFLYTDDDYSINAILLKMEALAKRNGVKVFVIDNLMVTQDDDRDEYKAQSNIVKKLKAFAKKYNAIVHLVAHPRKSMNSEISKDDVAGSANITNLADYVTTIERNFEDDREYDAKLSILKNRHTGNNASVCLKFDRDRKRFYSSDERIELGVDYLVEAQQFIQVQADWWEGV